MELIMPESHGSVGRQAFKARELKTWVPRPRCQRQWCLFACFATHRLGSCHAIQPFYSPATTASQSFSPEFWRIDIIGRRQMWASATLLRVSLRCWSNLYLDMAHFHRDCNDCGVFIGGAILGLEASTGRSAVSNRYSRFREAFGRSDLGGAPLLCRHSPVRLVLPVPNPSGGSLDFDVFGRIWHDLGFCHLDQLPDGVRTNPSGQCVCAGGIVEKPGSSSRCGHHSATGGENGPRLVFHRARHHGLCISGRSCCSLEAQEPFLAETT